MGWDATLTDDRGHIEGDWNYTHNTSCMIYAVLDDAGYERPSWTIGHPPQERPMPWWGVLDGMTGPEGAAYLDLIIRGLEADPARFEATNPENGWGDYGSLLAVLREMRNRVPEWPTTWECSG